MTNKANHSGHVLHQQAEKILREKASRELKNSEPVLPEDTQRILHDLQVHQIELEIQNEELRRTQAELALERERYFDLYDLAPVGYCTITAEGVVLAANLTAVTLLGLERWALLKQHMSRFILNEDQDIYYRHLKQLADTGEPQVFDLRMVKKDKTVCWMRLQAIAAHDPNSTPVYRVVLSNITEQKKVEDALRKEEQFSRTVLQTTTDSFWVVDVNKKIIQANDACCRKLGYTRDELLNLHVPDIDIVEESAETAARIQRIITNGSETFEAIHRKKDGSLFSVEISATYTENGQIVCFSRDITERKKAKEQIEKSLAEKDVMLREIHHRVKNNLQVISSLINLQSDNLTDNRMRNELDELHDRVRSMALIHEKLYQANDLVHLNFAGYATSLLRDLWRSHGALAEKVQLNLELAPVTLSIEAAVPCGLILNELAGNALKHAFPNNSAGEVTVGLQFDSFTNTVSMRVCDNGAGLPVELNWRQSSSLGLRLVQILAGQLRGTVEAGTGPGAEFQVTFPLKVQP